MVKVRMRNVDNILAHLVAEEEWRHLFNVIHDGRIIRWKDGVYVCDFYFARSRNFNFIFFCAVILMLCHSICVCDELFIFYVRKNVLCRNHEYFARLYH